MNSIPDIEAILFIVVCWGCDNYDTRAKLMIDERTILFVRTHWAVIQPLCDAGRFSLSERMQMRKRIRGAA